MLSADCADKTQIRISDFGLRVSYFEFRISSFVFRISSLFLLLFFPLLTFFLGVSRCCVVELLKVFRLGLWCLLLLGLGGCIEFEDEVVQWRYQPDEDVLLVTLRYEGIYGGDAKRSGKEKGKKKPAAAELSQRWRPPCRA